MEISGAAIGGLNGMTVGDIESDINDGSSE
jgi:hypothetical protein